MKRPVFEEIHLFAILTQDETYSFLITKIESDDNWKTFLSNAQYTVCVILLANKIFYVVS